VHQLVRVARQEAVVDEVVLFQRHPRVPALQVAGAVVAHALAQRQVLGACRRTDRVGLHEAQPLHGLGQRGG
jgi:hypothetical protein